MLIRSRKHDVCYSGDYAFNGSKLFIGLVGDCLVHQYGNYDVTAHLLSNSRGQVRLQPSIDIQLSVDQSWAIDDWNGITGYHCFWQNALPISAVWRGVYGMFADPSSSCMMLAFGFAFSIVSSTDFRSTTPSPSGQ